MSIFVSTYALFQNPSKQMQPRYSKQRRGGDGQGSTSFLTLLFFGSYMSRPRQVPALEWVVGTWLVKTLSKMIFVKLVSKISASVDLKQRQFPRTNSSRRAQPTLENSFTCLSFEIIIRKSIMKMHIKLEDLDEYAPQILFLLLSKLNILVLRWQQNPMTTSS